MSQEHKDKVDTAEARTQQTKSFMQQVRVASRRKYTPEEKVRIVLEGFRREVAVNELCRREGIKPGAYYAWTKDCCGLIKRTPQEELSKIVKEVSSWKVTRGESTARNSRKKR